MRVSILAPYVVLLVAGAVRFYRIGYPQSVVFDEVHFGKFISWILRREFFFDVFPPFGKMVLAATTVAFGWDTSHAFEQLAAPIDPSQGYAEVRSFNAAFGAISSMIIVLICNEADIAGPGALLAGLLSAFDNLSVVQSRVIMSDNVMMLCAELSLLFALRAFRERRRNRATFIPWFFASGVFSGLALATKWTSFATPFTITFIAFFGIPPFLKDGPLSQHLLFVFVAACFGTYYGVFDVFLRWCYQSGQGDAFMSPKFKSTILGSGVPAGTYGQIPMYMRVWELNMLMYQYQKGVRGDANTGASWIDWITNTRGTLYAINSNALGSKIVYLIMNPMMAMVVNVAAAGFLCTLFFYVRYHKYTDKLGVLRTSLQRGSAFLLAWFGSILPTVVVYRRGQLYQYLPALVYALLVTAQTVDMLPRRVQIALVSLTVPFVVLAFNYWSPWVYDLYLTRGEHGARQLLKGWRT